MPHAKVMIDFCLEEHWGRPPDMLRAADFNDTVPTARLLDWPDHPLPSGVCAALTSGGPSADAARTPVPVVDLSLTGTA